MSPLKGEPKYARGVEKKRRTYAEMGVAVVPLYPEEKEEIGR
jgi:hypothetical protein